MLRKWEIFGRRYNNTIYLRMTFKELTNELLLQGWRAYYIDDGDLFTSYHRMQKLTSIHNIELQIYEGKKIIFAKTTFPKEEVKQPTND